MNLTLRRIDAPPGTCTSSLAHRRAQVNFGTALGHTRLGWRCSSSSSRKRRSEFATLSFVFAMVAWHSAKVADVRLSPIISRTPKRDNQIEASGAPMVPSCAYTTSVRILALCQCSCSKATTIPSI